MKRTKTIVVTLEHADMHRGPLLLVNKAHPIRVPVAEKDLVGIAPGIRLDKQAALLYEAALQEAGGAAKILPVSGYRSRAEQECLYENTLAAHGEAYTKTYVALPGCSEHETGLALDVGEKSAQLDFITPDFSYAGICQAFRTAATRHGFIQRYPAGKEAITGIGHEPWHFRYVGIPHSELMAKNGFVLEEYIAWIKTHPWNENPYCFEIRGRVFDIGYIPACGEGAEIALHGEPYTISGNNVDGFLVAVWRCTV